MTALDTIAVVSAATPLHRLEPSETEILAATQVGRIVYGGVDNKTAEWDTCLRVVRALNGQMDFVRHYNSEQKLRKTQEAFVACNEFNKKYQRGTEGILTSTDGRKVFVKVENPALVFPSPGAGEVVMAWFYPVGWKDVSQFSTEQRVVTTAEELMMMGRAALAQGKMDVARGMFIASIESDPKYFHAINDLGALLQSQHSYVEAIQKFTDAIAINPNAHELWVNRATGLRAIGKVTEAIADYRQALRLAPGNEMALLHLASALDDNGEVEEAERLNDEHIARHPDDTNSHYNKALTLLSNEKFAEGWKEFEWRLRQPMTNAHYEHFNIPRWNGEDIAGKKVLIWCEQGIGDEIMTASMVPDAIATGAEITLLCHPRLIPLFRRSFPTITVDHRPPLERVEAFRYDPIRPEFLPDCVKNGTFDLQMSQADLGAAFRGSIEAFPNSGRFLVNNPETAMRARFEALRCEGKLVGISWHSTRNPRIGKLKSVDLREWEPILKTPGVTFVCLQYGPVQAELDMIEKEFGVKILTVPAVDQLTDMDAYASLVAAMDLVITVSNTTAHVAGGLGIPTWVMTPEGPGRLWYWLRKHNRAAWYSTVELFRQQRGLQWGSVVEEITESLRSWANAG